MPPVNNRQIVLINPLYREIWEYAEDNPTAIFPLGILSIGTVLSENKYNVKIIDACTNPNYLREIEDIIEERPLFVGISAMTAQLNSAFKISRLIRQKDKDRKIRIIWGGVHPTLFPEATARDPSIDIAVVGPGENTCLELANELSNNDRPNLNKILGIAFSENGKVTRTTPREFININNLPFINYELLDMDKYIYRKWGYGINSKERFLTLHTGIGCPYKCTFCANTALHNGRYSGKTAQRILDEVGFFAKKYNVKNFSFCDDLFFLNKARIKEFLDGLLERDYKIQWYGNIRADSFRPDFLSEGLVKKMKQAGCNRLGMGVESGSQRILDEVIKKGIKLEHVLEAARLCSKYDITVGYSFMMGLPGETKSDVLKTIDLMRKLKQLHSKCFFFGPQVYRPLPGSELYKKVVQLGFYDPQDLEEWASIEFNKNSRGKLSGGYLWNGFDPADLPWVNQVGLIRHIDFMQNFLFRDLRTIKLDFKYPVKVILILIGRFRVKLKFWYFPLEYWLYRFAVLIKAMTMQKKEP